MRPGSFLQVGWQVFLTVSILCCAAPPLPAQTLPIRLYTTIDGLAHDTVYRIVRDSRGFLWFGTFDGLSRFDGYGMTTYGVADGLPSQVVRGLLQTRDGEYWVATDGGLARFNPSGVRRRPANAPAQQSATGPAMFEVYYPAGDRSSRIVTSLLQDRAGTIWCGTFAGLYRLERHGERVTLERAAPIHRVTSIIEDRRGSLWVGSADGLFLIRRDGRVDRFSVRHGLPSNHIQSLLEDRDGRLWAGATPGSLSRLVPDPDVNKPVVVRVYSRHDGIRTESINALFQASDGTLWAGSNQGLIRFVQTSDGIDFQFRAYAEAQGLTYPTVHSLADDLNGHLWLGTSSGVAKVARNGITTFTAADGLGGTTAVLEDAGALLALGGPSSKSFINRCERDRFTPIETGQDQGTAFEHVWRANQGVLKDSAGEWWVATSQGLYRFPEAGSIERVVRARPNVRYTTRDGLASNNILRLFEDSRHGLWIAVAGGLSRWDRTSGVLHHFNEEDGWRWRFNPLSFAEDRSGAVWIGLSIGGGLVRYRNGQFTRFTEPGGLSAGGILHLLVDSSGRLWVPTSPGGVSRIDHPEARQPTIVPYTSADGLAGNDVEAVTEDRRGRIYLASGRGIDRLDPITGHIRHYNANDGTLRAGVNSALRDREGTLWFRYDTGIVRLVPEPDLPASAPSVLITGIRIGGEPQSVSALGEVDVAPRELPARNNDLQIDFVALGLSPGDGSRYEFRLEGARDLWSAIGEQRMVTLAHLAPGRYRFLVRAISADGTVSNGSASFAFTILPPVWQRWWFVAVWLMAVLLGAHVLQRYRHRRLLDLERVRTRIAADLHDDIGSSLSQIAVLSEVLRAQLGAQEPRVSRNISLINRVSQEALDSMSDIVWAINPAQDHLSNLVRRMRRVASDMLAARSIEFTFNAPVAGHDLAVGADMRRQMFLMFKETINNIVRHSRCSAVEIALNFDGHCISMVIADNGRGFDPDQAGEGNGLAGLRRRAASLGGEAVVFSQTGKGTTVTVRIPHRHWYLGRHERA